MIPIVIATPYILAAAAVLTQFMAERARRRWVPVFAFWALMGAGTYVVARSDFDVWGWWALPFWALAVAASVVWGVLLMRSATLPPPDPLASPFPVTEHNFVAATPPEPPAGQQWKPFLGGWALTKAEHPDNKHSYREKFESRRTPVAIAARQRKKRV